MAMLSLLGIYRYDNTVLDGLLANLPKTCYVPKDDTLYITPQELDRELLKDNLLFEVAEMPIVYTDPEILRYMITSWAGKQKWVWQHLFNTLWYKYNPIWNKDGKETYTDTDKTTRNVNREESGNNDAISNGKSERQPNITTDTVRSVSAFDTSGFSPAEQTESTETGSESSEASMDSKGKFANTGKETETVEHTFTHESIEAGNIGVTMTQEMIKSERDVVQYNLYDVIIRDFKKQFCILLY